MNEIDVPDESMSELLDSAFENFSEFNESVKKPKSDEIPKLDNEESIFKNFENELNNCLKNLSDSLTNLSDPKLFDECPENDDDEPSLSEMDSVLQDLLHQFLSKELVYPPLKAVAVKYPQWLVDNESKISSTDLDQRRTQYKKIEEVCTIYESYTNDSEISDDDFQRIMKLIEEAMINGAPPPDLVDSTDSGDVGNAFTNMMNSVNHLDSKMELNNCLLM